MQVQRSLLTGMLLAAVLLPLVGCEKKFTRSRFDTLYVGQEAWEVTETLGTADARFSDEWHYIHDEKDGYYKAVITFDPNKRISHKRWIDPEADVWEDPPLVTDDQDRDEVIIEQHIETIVE